jgi:hypothetical protein
MAAPRSPHKISTAATSTPADLSSLEMTGISACSVSRATTVVDGPVIEVIDVDLGVIHIAAPTRAVPA